jgi:hypothetical protein
MIREGKVFYPYLDFFPLIVSFSAPGILCSGEGESLQQDDDGGAGESVEIWYKKHPLGKGPNRSN